MRLNRTAIAVVGSALLVGGLGATAFASGSLSPNTADSTQPTSVLTVNWSNITIPTGLNQIVVIQQCVKNDAGAFNRLDDCAPQFLNPPVGATGSGSQAFTVFNGLEQVNQAWGCGPLTDPGAGVPATPVCYVRIAPGSPDNTSSDEFFPFTYAPPANVPEVPLNVLLPGSAIAMLGGAFLIARRRQAKTA
jgi:hypothetical protein